jgi:hypothetical protein
MCPPAEYPAALESFSARAVNNISHGCWSVHEEIIYTFACMRKYISVLTEERQMSKYGQDTDL